MTDSGSVKQIRLTLAALEKGGATIADLDKLIIRAVRSGALTEGDANAELETAWARGLIPGEMVARFQTTFTQEPIRRAATPEVGASIPSADSPETGTRRREPSMPSSPQPEPVPTDEPTLMSQVLGGRYRLERELGEGGMGRVYFARDEQVEGETFAIKVLKSGIRADALKLLREEVHKTRKLSHPNIVDVHSLNSDGTRHYVLMEYLEGKPLNVLLDEDFGRGMPFSRAWPIIEDVGAALACAHDHSVIHSDLKPANIFVTTSGRTKLLDFGIARASRGDAVRSGVFALTPAYASCEMLEGREPDARDDIYSFGCVIYEMLSGKHPFDGRDALEARDSGLRAPPLAALSRGQNAALAKALAFERQARTTSVEELLAALSADRKLPVRRLAMLGGALIALFAVLGVGYLAIDKLWLSKRTGASAASSLSPAAGAFSPPPHSIAVLPFVNMSGDKDQEYFSDGLTEELLNSLAGINELQVAARTSSFAFKGQETDVGTIARKLNVGAVLEGSVRRSAHTVRVTAQLINAVTGYHIWSQTYDRPLTDILKVQTELADAVAKQLAIKLGGGTSEAEVQGGTHNFQAYDSYLKGIQLNTLARGTMKEADLRAALAAFDHAIALDPNFALAHLRRAKEFLDIANFISSSVQTRAEAHAKAREATMRAVALAPELGETHLQLGSILAWVSFDFGAAVPEFERSVELSPGNAHVLNRYAQFNAQIGRSDVAKSAIERAIKLDPLDDDVYVSKALVYYSARQFGEALRALKVAEGLKPGSHYTGVWRALILYSSKQMEPALRECEPANAPMEADDRLMCLAHVYHALGRQAEAQEAFDKLKALDGDSFAYNYATICAQWGDTPCALDWLAKADQLHDPSISFLIIDPLMDPIRHEPFFKEIVRRHNFPPRPVSDTQT
jgi:TolB-like protein/Tfp pilus assembly protein PilF